MAAACNSSGPCGALVASWPFWVSQLRWRVTKTFMIFWQHHATIYIIKSLRFQTFLFPERVILCGLLNFQVALPSLFCPVAQAAFMWPRRPSLRFWRCFQLWFSWHRVDIVDPCAWIWWYQRTIPFLAFAVGVQTWVRVPAWGTSLDVWWAREGIWHDVRHGLMVQLA